MSEFILTTRTPNILVATLNYIRLWDISFRESVEYSFIAIILPGLIWPRVLVPIRVPSMCQIDLFENYSYLIEIL